MLAHTPTDATTLVMDSAEGFESLLEAAGSTAVARWDDDWSNHEFDNQVTYSTQPLAAFDNRPTWDNPTATFDNRPTWDNWKNK
ncbi:MULTISPECIES: multiple cyclophane-containing RiPP AmcA [unclassified Streptomyces]|uniref:multiple cyclophane-containing RiPP AmcA n=1 Tax=unclassified Streptomyces TaxID=2593676 RepID=UPI002E2959AD|nr:multiple cyclophane-containing RiPP AmcA [Streptomyces sp. NBC_01439]